MAIFKRNKNLDNYKVIRSESWGYRNPEGTYYTNFVVVEDKIIFEQAKGKPNLRDTKLALNVLKNVIKENFKVDKPHYVTDSRDIKGADAEVRKYVAEFHKNNPVFESVSLIASPFTKALFSIVKNLGVGDFRNWKVYRNENYCIEEILDDQYIIGQSQENTEYELIYKVLNDLNSNQFSYEKLLNKANSNEELSSVIQAINIINEENRLKQNEFDSGIDNKDSVLHSKSVLYKSIIENTNTVVALMDESYHIVNTNSNFNAFFGVSTVINEKFTEFLDIENGHYKTLEKGNHVQFKNNYREKVLSCKLYRIESIDGLTYVVFVGEDVSEKENLKATEQKLLKELQLQNYKLLKVNHLLSHEINHQIASLSQILHEYRGSICKDELVEDMITRVHDDLNLSLDKMNQTLFENKTEVRNQNLINNNWVSRLDEIDVFLIDDDEITNLLNEKIIKNNLPSCNLQVFMDGEHSLDFMRKHKIPDVILLDMYMPGMDGFEFLERMKSLDLQVAPKVFMLSSSRDPGEIKLVKSHNEVSGYILKPLSNQKFKDVFFL